LINAHTLGSIARDILAQPQEVRLMGVTSRGLFLITAQAHVLFLTNDPYRGPLTLNLASALPALQEQTSDPVAIQPGGLWFSKSGLRISTRAAAVWTPPACALTAPGGISARQIRADRLESAARLVRSQPDPALDALRRDLAQSPEGQVTAGVTAGLAPFLGRGPGLTPSGDDLVLGFLLALNRWQSLFPADFPRAAVSDQLARLARQKTTSLSASLIECAALGLADERLIEALDGLVTGSPGIEACAERFNQWGSTSGASVFQGIRLGFGLSSYSASEV